MRFFATLPFEHSGVISEWQLQLPANPSKGDPRQFNYDTISDVILHLRYTAREGGELLRNGTVTNLKARIDEAQAAGSVRLFSMRHEFPTEWARFKRVQNVSDTSPAELTLEFGEEHFPYWSKGRLGAIKRVDLFTKNGGNGTEIVTHTPAGSVEVTTRKPDGTENKEILNNLTNISLPQPPDKFTLKFKLHFDKNSMEDLWLAVTWGKRD